jgi:ribosome-associated protein
MYKTLDNILTQLEDNKALDIISIDLKGKSDIADFLVIATGTSNRHVGSLSELKKDGIKDIKAEGINKSDWVLIDSGDVIVHIFRKEVREFYNLEKLWQTNIDTN